ncbi:MAG: DNA repair protein RecN [Bacteroidales bacterium]|nr:MAG: DNA repair protein RecN [Bacteroidales bacterium]
MIQSLSIENYAIINSLEIEFSKGLSIITGETGAGKSILLGALSLILGKRADTSILKEKTRKCIVEGTFDITEYGFQNFFDENDIDYEDLTILRREIYPNGKSRAFINDSPVNLNILSELGIRFIDIHSQHQNLNLSNSQFQLKVIDSYSRSEDLLITYQDIYNLYKELRKEYHNLLEKSQQSQADLDYYQFQFSQLDIAKLKENEQDELEQELEKLNHAEEIINNLNSSVNALSGEDNTVLNQLKDVNSFLTKILKFYPDVAEFEKRLESTYIELKDVANELELLKERIELDPEKLEYINERLDLIYSLQQKHKVNSIKELQDIKESLRQKINEVTSYEFKLEDLKKRINECENKLSDYAQRLSQQRQNSLRNIEKEITVLLIDLGIPNGRFEIQHEITGDYSINGIDRIQFLFSANKNIALQEISRIASGGELSRLMLSIKSLLSDSSGLPTIIFDEIDMGVSGEIADKVGNIIKRMSAGMQIINITHLPQVACKGDFHYLVYKSDEGESTTAHVKLLNNEERHIEIARMLSGEQLTEAAMENARELLKN